MEGTPSLAKLHVYLTDQCNQSCPHCWVDAGPLKTAHLEADRVTPVVDSALSLGLAEVKVTGGEPLLFPGDALRILEHAAAAGLVTRLETNSLSLRVDDIVRLRRTGTRVGTSLDGCTPPSHDGFRRTPGGFDRAVRAIGALASAGVSVDVVSCLRRANLNEVDGIVALATSLGVQTLKFNFPSSYGRARDLEKKRLLCTVEDTLRTVMRIEDHSRLALPMRVDVDVPRAFRRYPLPGPRCNVLGLLSVLPDGRYSVCGIGITHPELTLGRIDENGLEEVWTENEVLARLRRSLASGGHGVCATCSEFVSCRAHCIACSLSKYSSLNGPHPLCEAAFEGGLFPSHKLMVAGATPFDSALPSLAVDDHSGSSSLQGGERA